MNQEIGAARIFPERAGLTVIDIQEKLLPSIFDNQKLVANVVTLIKGAQILQLPVLSTEQYPKGMGRTVPSIQEVLGNCVRIEKLAFSACGAEAFSSALDEKRVSDVILCGIEAHICICQTALDLLARGNRVFVVADAVSSRTVDNCQIGLRRMQEAGATIVSTEMILFELLRAAGTDEFRQILSLVK